MLEVSRDAIGALYLSRKTSFARDVPPSKLARMVTARVGGRSPLFAKNTARITTMADSSRTQGFIPRNPLKKVKGPCNLRKPHISPINPTNPVNLINPINPTLGYWLWFVGLPDELVAWGYLGRGSGRGGRIRRVLELTL